MLWGFPGDLNNFKGKTICWQCKQELLATVVTDT
jgi:hypothetical protein